MLCYESSNFVFCKDIRDQGKDMFKVDHDVGPTDYGIVETYRWSMFIS